MLLNKNSNIIRIKSKIEYIKDEYLVIKKNLILNENFHKIQKRFMRRGFTIESKKFKDKLLFEFKDETIFNQYITTKDAFIKNQVNVGYLKDYYELYDKMYKDTANNFGVKDIPFKHNKHYKSHIKDLYIGSIHPILYITISEGDYVVIVFTNLTSKNKEIVIDYLNNKKVLKFEEVGTHSPTGKQYLCTTTIWVKMHKDDFNKFLELNINVVNLGGMENINMIKDKAYDIIFNRSTPKVYQELHAAYVINRAAEEYENQNNILYRFYDKKNNNLIEEPNEE